jgi:CRP-like cAMP-binding protein
MLTEDTGIERKQFFARERCRDVLGSIPLLSDLPKEELDGLARSATLRTYLCHAEIYASGDEPRHLYVVEHGAVLLGSACDPPDNKKLAVYWVAAGDVFGEVEFLEADIDGQAPVRQMRAEAASDCSIVAVDRRQLRRLLERFPQVALRLGRLVAARHRRIVEVLERQSFIGLVEIRLAQVLIERAELLGVREGAVVRMTARTTHQQLGDLLAADRRSILETLRLWSDAGLVHMDSQGIITICDIRGLRAIAGMRSGQRRTWEADAWIALIDADLASGYNVRAFDEANDALRRPSLARQPLLRHRAVLAAARSGATEQALALLRSFGMDHTDPNDDIAALEPRLLKDLALFAADPASRCDLARQSAARYLDIFERSANYYPGINAASMFAVAGQADKAKEIARRVAAAIAGEDASYYALATRAEAALIRGDLTQADSDLGRAVAAGDANAGAIAATRRQLRMLCAIFQYPTERLLGRLPQRKVICYTGHMLNARDLDVGSQRSLIARLDDGVAALLHRIDVGWGYGALACGGDLVIAEALLDAGAELHVVLPFRSSDFSASSVKPGGKDWLHRFNRCLERAYRVIELDRSRPPVSDETFYLGNRFAAGLVVRRARELDADAEMVAVWDGIAPSAIAGTSRAVAEWKTAGRPLHHLPCPWARKPAPNAGGTLAPDGFLPSVFCRGSAAGFDELSGLTKRLSRRGEFRLGADQIAWTFPTLGDAARCALTIAGGKHCQRHKLSIICDVGLAGSSPEMSVRRAWAAASHPECPTGIAFATEPFMAEAALVASQYGGEYAGRVQVPGDIGTLAIYALKLLPDPTFRRTAAECV